MKLDEFNLDIGIDSKVRTKDGGYIGRVDLIFNITDEEEGVILKTKYHVVFEDGGRAWFDKNDIEVVG